MRNVIAGIIIGILLVTGITYAYRIPKPQRITAFDHNGLVVINEALEQLWDLTNGRYNLNVVTTNPEGVVSGEAGDMVLYSAAGGLYIEICSGGTVWYGEELSNTP
jgi:hypothetical protein